MVYTNVGTLLLEALVLAAGLVVIFFLVHMLAMAVFHDRAMTSHWLLACQVAVAGALVHVTCEYSGLNEWYCKQRPKK